MPVLHSESLGVLLEEVKHGNGCWIVVSGMDAGGSAAVSGVQIGDTILAINGNSLSNVTTILGLGPVLRGLQLQRSAVLTLLRAGRQLMLSLPVLQPHQQGNSDIGSEVDWDSRSVGSTSQREWRLHNAAITFRSSGAQSARTAATSASTVGAGKRDLDPEMLSQYLGRLGLDSDRDRRLFLPYDPFCVSLGEKRDLPKMDQMEAKSKRLEAENLKLRMQVSETEAALSSVQKDMGELLLVLQQLRTSLEEERAKVAALEQFGARSNQTTTTTPPPSRTFEKLEFDMEDDDDAMLTASPSQLRDCLVRERARGNRLTMLLAQARAWGARKDAELQSMRQLTTSLEHTRSTDNDWRHHNNNDWGRDATDVVAATAAAAKAQRDKGMPQPSPRVLGRQTSASSLAAAEELRLLSDLDTESVGGGNSNNNNNNSSNNYGHSNTNPTTTTAVSESNNLHLSFINNNLVSSNYDFHNHGSNSTSYNIGVGDVRDAAAARVARSSPVVLMRPIASA